MNCGKWKETVKRWDFWGTLAIAALTLALCGAAAFTILNAVFRQQEREKGRVRIPTNMSEEASERIDAYLEQDYWGMSGRNSLGLIDLDTLELFSIELSEAGEGTRLEWTDAGGMRIHGRTDLSRGYFDGTVAWDKTGGDEGVCIVNFATGEKMRLEQSLRAFLLGDYYISCAYGESPSQAQLLVFFCPPGRGR